MPDITTPFVNALTAVVEAAAPQVSVIFRDAQVFRINPNNLIEAFENAQSAGLQPPYVVIAVGAMTTWPDYAPMGVKALMAPVDIYYVRRTPLSFSTVISSTVDNTGKTVSDTSWMFPGQTLRLETTNVLVRVLSIPLAGKITLESAQTSTVSEHIREAQAIQDLEHKASVLRDAIIAYTGGAFQCMAEDPVVDCSSGNPANRLFLIGNVPMMAAHITAKLLVAESY